MAKIVQSISEVLNKLNVICQATQQTQIISRANFVVAKVTHVKERLFR